MIRASWCRGQTLTARIIYTQQFLADAAKISHFPQLNQYNLLHCYLASVETWWELEFCSLLYLAQSVQRWATDWMIRVLGFDFRRGLRIFLFTTASRTTLGPSQPPIQRVPGVLSLGVKRSGREADDSPPSSVKVEECVGLYLHSPSTLSWRTQRLKVVQF
jgi:hypothetical protein